jgi:hypothetical protein
VLKLSDMLTFLLIEVLQHDWAVWRIYCVELFYAFGVPSVQTFVDGWFALHQISNKAPKSRIFVNSHEQKIFKRFRLKDAQSSNFDNRNIISASANSKNEANWKRR